MPKMWFMSESVSWVAQKNRKENSIVVHLTFSVGNLSKNK